MRRMLVWLVLGLTLLAGAGAAAEATVTDLAEVTITAAKETRGFQDNPVTVSSPAPGELTLRLKDAGGQEVRTLCASQPVLAGETTLVWDGLGRNQEKLSEGSYTLCATLTTENQTYTCEKAVTAARCRQALLFALPSAKTLYLGGGQEWFAELKLVRPGKVCTAFYRKSDLENPIAVKTKALSGYKVHTYSWDGVVNKVQLEPGDYRVVFWAEENPDYRCEMDVTLVAGAYEASALALTGALLPERGATDAELWQFLSAPLTVVDLKATSHQKLYSQPSKLGKVLGTVHGQSQGLQVLELRQDGWTKVGVWIHEDGSYVEGYVPTDRLTVVQTESDYGLVLDKKTQTLTVYHLGEQVGSLRCSTGLVAKNKLFRETPAGAYRTIAHMSDYSTDGNSYDYVIRYDGGNLLHQISYQTKRGVQDFSQQAALLGQKASHGCIRIQPALQEGDLSAYWIWTHLPYGTKLLILDDEAERTAQAAAVQGYTPEPEPVAAATPAPVQLGETEVVLTVGGDTVLGTREIWQSSADGLPAALAEKGLTWPFEGLLSIFEADDMTLVNLECVLKDDTYGMDRDKLYIFRGQTAYAQALALSSIEQVNIANNHFIDYQESGKAATKAALDAYGVAYSGYSVTYVAELNGHKIGFGGCRETIFKQKSSTIRRDIESLRAQGAEVIVYSCHWGEEYSPTHNATQLRMAQAAAEAGADIIIGTHPHVVQGVDQVEGAVVLWSLGNMMFGGTHEMVTYDAMLSRLTLRFSKDGDYTGAAVALIPILTSSSAQSGVNDFHPVQAEGEDAARILQKVQADSGITLAQEMWFPAAK